MDYMFLQNDTSKNVVTAVKINADIALITMK